MMTSPRRSSFLAVVGFSTIAGSGILTSPAVAVAQGRNEQVQSLSANPPKIWEDRGPIEQLDLFWGGGSPERVPVGPFTFVSEDLGGTNPKANVRDVNGVLWGVKWDEEAQSEVAASRLAWAMGLRVDETYYKLLSVPETTGTTDWYMVGDYGACFGKMGGRTSHSKYRLRNFVANPPVVSSVSGDTVHLEFKGRNASAHASVPREGARFFASRVAGLTLAQVEDAFRAAKANDQDLHGFAEAVYGRIREVVTKVQ